MEDKKKRFYRINQMFYKVVIGGVLLLVCLGIIINFIDKHLIFIWEVSAVVYFVGVAVTGIRRIFLKCVDCEEYFYFHKTFFKGNAFAGKCVNCGKMAPSGESS